MESLLQDLRYAARMLKRNRAFTVVAVITMALGIGANTAIFSVVNGVLLTSLPLKDPDRLVFILETNPRFPGPGIQASTLNYRDWKEQNSSFQSIAARQAFSVNLTSSDQPEKLQGEKITWDYFPTLGVRPIEGRTFSREEDHPGAERVVLLSYGLWQRRFGGDRSLIGQTISIDGRDTTVIGVMPNDYRPSIEFWVPLAINYENADRSMHNIQVIGRLSEGITKEHAQSDMSAIARRLAADYPELNAGWGVSLVPLHDLIVFNIRPALMILLGAVGFILLIACANVANLLLARAASREKEIAVRLALGASRGRIVRQVLTESVLISLIGAAVGLLIALWGTEALVNLNKQGIPLAANIAVDSRVLVFTLLVAVASGVLFGLVPALQATRPNLSEALKDGGRSGSGYVRGRRIRSLLVITEVALSLVLLAGAGLLIKSFARLQQVDAGFNQEHLLTMQVFLPPAQYPKPEDQFAFFKEAIHGLTGVPGVVSASAISQAPLAGGGPQYIFSVEGRPLPAPSDAPLAHYRIIANDYFKTMGIPLIKGRFFTEADDASSSQVIIINQTMAEMMWPGEDAINKRMTVGVPLSDEVPEYATVIGVVGNVKNLTLNTEGGMQMYQSVFQAPARTMTFVVRAQSDPAGAVESARGVIASLNPSLPVSNVKAMETIMSESVAPFRFNMLLLALFAAVALALTVVGVYGVMNYSVTERTQEIGIRMALGARPEQVRTMILRQGIALSIIGLVVGLAGCFVVTGMMSSLLFGVSATDPVVFACVALILIAVSLVACYIPARKATRVDPIIALRYE